jgi:diguanylate cyclase (GGDEF)-like protein
MRSVCEGSREPAELLEQIARLQADVARLEQKVRESDHLAHFDALIPIPNRRGMLRELKTMIARRERYNTSAAVLFVDLDGLKMLNDCFGHEGGDAALIYVAHGLLCGTRDTDCVARIGGDEFCVLLDHADEASADETAARLVNVVAGINFMFNGQTVPLSVAIGMTVIERGDTPTAVLARADEAMYRVKAQRGTLARAEVVAIGNRQVVA